MYVSCNRKDTYMRISDPKLVYFRMIQDAARLKDWADRMGNDNHKAFATELERILVLKQPLFTADLPATKTKVDQRYLDAEKTAIAKAVPVPNHIRAKYALPDLHQAEPQALSPFDKGYNEYPDTTKNLFTADSVEWSEWWQGYAAKDNETSAD